MREAARVLARGGQPSVAEIAKAAGVSRTTFYRAFPSRHLARQPVSPLSGQGGPVPGHPDCVLPV